MLGQAAQQLGVRKQAALPAVDGALLRQLATVLVAAALLETGLLRLVSRVGVHVPREGVVSDGFEAASLVGSVAFNFASVLSIILVVVLLGALVLRIESGLGRASLAAISAAMLGGLGLSLATGAAAADALFGVAITLLVGILGLVLVRQDGMSGAGRLALLLIVGAYFFYQYYALSYLAYRLLDYAAVPPLSIASLRLGEGLVVLAGGAVFWAWGVGRWRRMGVAGGAAVALVLLAITVGSLSPASTVSILALWTTGLSFFLSFPVYLLSLGLFLVTMVACWRSDDAFWIGAGLFLLLVAGYMPEATYHHLVLLLGVAFLSGAVALAAPDSAEAEPSR